MKKIATLLLAAAMVCGVSTGAKAIDFKAGGEWIMSFDYGMNGGFTGGNGQTGFNKATGRYTGEDEFEASQRVRLQLDAVASEALSGSVFFEIGRGRWGRTADGLQLGGDNPNQIKLRRAYIDWMVPQTDLKVRMGLQGLALPSFTTGSQVFNDDVAGISLSYQFNENVGLTAFWARAYNDNYTDNVNINGSDRSNYLDNIDAFALVLPLTFDGVKVTPWAMYAAIGPNADTGGESAARFASGMNPARGALHKDGTTLVGKDLNRWGRSRDTYSDAFWAGVTGELTLWDPLRIAWDVNYGSATHDQSRLNRAGWLASLLVEYKLDWGVPGIYGWYGSGDDSNPANGSERMPHFAVGNTNNGFSNFAFNGGPYIAREAILGWNMSGTWGIGARLKDMSFLEDLKHTFRVNLIGGTNSTTMTRYMRQGDFYNRAIGDPDITGPNANFAGTDPLYMTTKDYAMEFGLTNTYKMYENFTVFLDMAYITTWIDHSRSVWGNSAMNGDDDTVKDPWNINLSFVYSF